MDALGKSWHQKCFRCKSCGDLLTSNYSDVNADPYCDDCGRKVKAVTAANAENEEEVRKRKIEEEKKKLAAKIAEKKRLLAQGSTTDGPKEDGTHSFSMAAIYLPRQIRRRRRRRKRLSLPRSWLNNNAKKRPRSARPVR
jgi:hypothetical protein